jgi:hypothetical protein
MQREKQTRERMRGSRTERARETCKLSGSVESFRSTRCGAWRKRKDARCRSRGAVRAELATQKSSYVRCIWLRNSASTAVSVARNDSSRHSRAHPVDANARPELTTRAVRCEIKSKNLIFSLSLSRSPSSFFPSSDCVFTHVHR